MIKVREMVNVYEARRAQGGEAYDAFIQSQGLDPMRPVLIYFDRIEPDWLTIKGAPLAEGGKTHVGV